MLIHQSVTVQPFAIIHQHGSAHICSELHSLSIMGNGQQRRWDNVPNLDSKICFDTKVAGYLSIYIYIIRLWWICMCLRSPGDQHFKHSGTEILDDFGALWGSDIIIIQLFRVPSFDALPINIVYTCLVVDWPPYGWRPSIEMRTADQERRLTRGLAMLPMMPRNIWMNLRYCRRHHGFPHGSLGPAWVALQVALHSFLEDSEHWGAGGRQLDQLRPGNPRKVTKDTRRSKVVPI